MSSLFGSSQKMPEPKPVRMPTSVDAEEIARKKAQRLSRMRQGRRSTIMTEELAGSTNTLGGGI